MNETLKDIIGFLGALWEATGEVIKLLSSGVSLLFGTILAVLIFLTNGDPKTLEALIACMICDYITGIIKALKLYKRLNFYIGFFGIFKKFVILVIVVAGSKIDIILNIQDLKLNCFYMIVCFYTANEVISILENAAALGIKAPERLIKILHSLKDIKIDTKNK